MVIKDSSDCKEGRVFRNAEFPFITPDRSSGIAAIYTGTTPSVNGIIADNWLDISTLRPKNSVDDLAYMGNYTDENTSPSQLLTSTITDELKIATQGKGLVYSISPFRETEIGRAVQHECRDRSRMPSSF